MLALLRIIVVTVLAILICTIGFIVCIFNPMNTRNVARFAHIFGSLLRPIIGIKVINRPNTDINKYPSCIYIANHQNNYDVLVAGNIYQDNTIIVGKKSLIWIPFFGPLYWITGNILLNRDDKSKALSSINQVVDAIKQKQISIWMFPEGTRSRGRGLLPFKTGAFRTAIAAGVPIVPICISNINDIRPNRLNNGVVIAEMLAPIETTNLGKHDIKALMEQCHSAMSAKLKEIDAEAAKLSDEAGMKR